MPHELFVRLWQAADSPGEVAGQTDGKMTPTQVASRASFLRKKGVKLKRFASRAPIDVDSLNTLCD